MQKQDFLVQDLGKVEPVTPCMDVYKAKIQSDGSLDKLKLIIVVIGDIQDKELCGDTWSPTVFMRNLKYFFGRCSLAKGKNTSVRFYWRIIVRKI